MMYLGRYRRCKSSDIGRFAVTHARVQDEDSNGRKVTVVYTGGRVEIKRSQERM